MSAISSAHTHPCAYAYMLIHIPINIHGQMFSITKASGKCAEKCINYKIKTRKYRKKSSKYVIIFIWCIYNYNFQSLHAHIHICQCVCVLCAHMCVRWLKRCFALVAKVSSMILCLHFLIFIVLYAKVCIHMFPNILCMCMCVYMGITSFAVFLLLSSSCQPKLFYLCKHIYTFIISPIKAYLFPFSSALSNWECSIHSHMLMHSNLPVTTVCSQQKKIYKIPDRFNG